MEDSIREKLEQELRFLKESYDAEVISKEEYLKGKERIEKKLKDNGNNDEGFLEGQEKNEKVETESSTKTDSTKTEEKPDEDKKAEEPPKEQQEEVEAKKDRPGNKIFKYAVVFVVLTLVIFFGYSLINQKKNTDGNKGQEMNFVPVCSSDADCAQNGRQGLCAEPGTKNARCQFPEAKKTRVTVLNDRKNCFNCDTGRVFGILENWFGSLEATEIDYNTTQGKEMADKLKIRILPAYAFEAGIVNLSIYPQIKQTFVKKDSSFLLSENAAASTFYFRRENIPNKLDFFVREGDSASERAEKNLKEFLDVFQDVDFEKHASDSESAKELGIRIFPSFLVNNRVRFSGIHPAEAIKNNFCSMNKLEECKKELSQHLMQ